MRTAGRRGTLPPPTTPYKYPRTATDSAGYRMRAVNSWLSISENQENRRNETGLSVDFPLRAVELNLPDNFPIKREQTKRWSSESRTMLASVMPSRDRVR